MCHIPLAVVISWAVAAKTLIKTTDATPTDHLHQKAFRNKSHTSHGQRPRLKRSKSKVDDVV